MKVSREEILHIARSMLKENMDIDTIKKVTSLTEEEIKMMIDEGEENGTIDLEKMKLRYLIT